MRATFKNVLQQEQHRHKPRLILKIRTHHVCSPLFAALAALSCCCSGPPPAPLLRLHLLLLPPLMRQPLLLSITLHRARQQRACEYCRACVCVCVNQKCVRIHVQHSRNTKVFSAQGQNCRLQVNLANVVFYSYLATIITFCVAGRDQHIRRYVSTVWSPVIHL